ncbi:iron uptake protein [Aquabacterium sp. UBA2148]|uniref:iron uptake protein n=1 Tax=Aquabacterium sp. UBA2148 TaxID=1946042 RepID=UPI0025800037|nr:iron uptake protein [Aquabacterium sp. UBA2148]
MSTDALGGARTSAAPSLSRLMPTPPPHPSRWSWIHRIALSILGAYALTWGLCALAVVALVANGSDFHEAEHGVLIAAFLVYLAVFLWSFATPRLSQVWLAVGGGAAVSMAIALFWQHQLMQ